MSGCSGYQQACLPGTVAEVPPCPEVSVGNEVRLVLTDGRALDGEVVSVDADEIVLARAGNYGLTETVAARQDVARIERRHSSAVAGALVRTAGTAMLIFSGLAILVGLTITTSGRLD